MKSFSLLPDQRWGFLFVSEISVLKFRTPGRNRRMRRFIRATLTLALTISFPAVQPDIFTLFTNRPTKYL